MRRVFARSLTTHGIAVDEAATAETALGLVRREAFDVVVLDITLPGHDGVWFIETVRGQGITMPIMVSSGRGADADIERALDAGADEYVTKPISGSVLSARVRALARRTARPARGSGVGDVSLQAESHTASGGRGTVSLTAKEFALLSLFIEQPQRVLSRTELLRAVWGFDFDPETSVLDVAMHRLRQKLAKITDRVSIESRRGAGFALVKSDASPAPPKPHR